MGIRLGTKLYQTRPGMLAFECPGCESLHAVYTDDSNVVDGVINQWTYNNNGDKPTFFPSVHIHKNNPKFCCHSWVNNGRITFLLDCFHPLKGQTVDIPDWD
jgi:hypothetical protein